MIDLNAFLILNDSLRRGSSFGISKKSGSKNKIFFAYSNEQIIIEFPFLIKKD